MNKCPHCGDTSGFYTNNGISGKMLTCYTWDGSESGHSEQCYMDRNDDGKEAWCRHCHQYIGPTEGLLPGIPERDRERRLKAMHSAVDKYYDKEKKKEGWSA